MSYAKEEWRIYQDEEDFIIIADNGTVGRIYSGKAHAHLIVAAPKMYEALKSILDQKDDPQLYTALGGQDWIDIENALAEAEGNQ